MKHCQIILTLFGQNPNFQYTETNYIWLQRVTQFCWISQCLLLLLLLSHAVHTLWDSVFTMADVMNKSRPPLPSGSTTVSNDCGDESCHIVIIAVSGTVVLNVTCMCCTVSVTASSRPFSLPRPLFAALQTSGFCHVCSTEWRERGVLSTDFVSLW